MQRGPAAAGSDGIHRTLSFFTRGIDVDHHRCAARGERTGQPHEAHERRPGSRAAEPYPRVDKGVGNVGQQQSGDIQHRPHEHHGAHDGEILRLDGVDGVAAQARDAEEELEEQGAEVIYSVRSESRRKSLEALLAGRPVFLCDVEDEGACGRLAAEIAIGLPPERGEPLRARARWLEALQATKGRPPEGNTPQGDAPGEGMGNDEGAPGASRRRELRPGASGGSETRDALPGAGRLPIVSDTTEPQQLTREEASRVIGVASGRLTPPSPARRSIPPAGVPDW